MPQIGTPNINFSFYSTQSPKDLCVLDFSHWGALQNRPAKISITVPGSSKPISYPLLKNTFNNYNSNTLYQNCGDCTEFEDLDDGIYFIEVESTAPFKTSKYYLKTDATRLELDKIYIIVGYDYKDAAKELIESLSDIEAYLKVAEAHTRRGDINEAQRFFQEVQNKIKTCKQKR